MEKKNRKRENNYWKSSEALWWQFVHKNAPSIRSSRVELGNKWSFTFSRSWNKKCCKDNEVANSFSYTIILPQENPWRKNRSLAKIAELGGFYRPKPGREGIAKRASKWEAWKTPEPVGCHIEIARIEDIILGTERFGWYLLRHCKQSGTLNGHMHTTGSTYLIPVMIRHYLHNKDYTVFAPIPMMPWLCPVSLSPSPFYPVLWNPYPIGQTGLNFTLCLFASKK